MEHKRIQVRVPLNSAATLKSIFGTHVGVKAIDISPEGLGVSNFPGQTTIPSYHVVVTLKSDVHISFLGRLVKHQNSRTAGFKILEINKEDLAVINKLVEDYQQTDEFIKQIEDFDVLPQHYIDENGNELEVTFEAEE